MFFKEHLTEKLREYQGQPQRVLLHPRTCDALSKTELLSRDGQEGYLFQGIPVVRSDRIPYGTMVIEP